MAIRYVAGSNPLFLGRQGENLAREIEFDISDWVENFGEGTVQALHRRDKDAGPYPLNPTFNDGKAVWLVTDADTAYAGSGECELRYTVNDVLVKSKVYKTLVAPSLEGEITNPEALPDWVANVLAVGDTLKSAEILSHIHYVESMDRDNPLCIRDLDSGTYILHGYFKPVAAVTQKFTFSTDMLVSVVKWTSTSFVQVFYSKDNAIQYLSITDESFTRKDAKLVNMESVANKVTVLDENSDHEHYPSAKAVYDAIEKNGVPKDGESGQLLSKTETGTEWVDPPQSGVQSDWNQNDETHLDYVKNRPFYDENKEFVVTWDGDATDLTCIDDLASTGMYLYKISDLIPEKSDLIGATLCISDGTTMQLTESQLNNTQYESVCLSESFIIFSKIGEMTLFGMNVVIPETGIYSLLSNGMYTTSLSWEKNIPKQIDAKFIPDMDSVILNSSTADSTKKFKITVDDSGTLTATEVT